MAVNNSGLVTCLVPNTTRPMWMPQEVTVMSMRGTDVDCFVARHLHLAIYDDVGSKAQAKVVREPIGYRVLVLR